MVKNFKGPDEILCDGVQTVSKFSYLDDRINTTDWCKTAVTARTRMGWMKFRKCSEILKGRRLSLKMKGRFTKVSSVARERRGGYSPLHWHVDQNAE